MTLHNPLAATPTASTTTGRSVLWPITALLVGAVAILAASYLPAALVPVAMSVVLVTAGLIVAAAYYLSGHRIGHGPSAVWEIAGVLVLLGFAAAMLTDDGQALSLFAQMEARMTALLQ